MFALFINIKYVNLKICCLVMAINISEKRDAVKIEKIAIQINLKQFRAAL